MASNFVGSTVLITVKSPPNAQLKGIVQDIQDRVLFLQDVFWLDSGAYMPSLEIPGSILLDLEVIPNEYAESRPSPLISAPSPNTLAADQQPNTAFVDPAILSVGKPPPKSAKRADTEASATLTEPFSNLSVASGGTGRSELDTTELSGIVAAESTVPAVNQVSSPIQQAFQDLIARSLHTNNNAPVFRVHHEASTQIDHMSSDQHQPPQTQISQRKSVKSRGRKQADQSDKGLLKVQELTNRKVKKTTTATTSKPSARTFEAHNGWATEEATDIQELGEFDFAANLSKFDKHAIFRQLKEDDTVAAGDRLVGHNRIAKPGTAGGKNLHWTENVLDAPADNPNHWNSEAGETADDLEERQDSGRSSTRQKSQTRNRMIPSRKGSHNTEDPIRRQSQMTIRQSSFEAVSSPKIATRKSFASPYIGASGQKGSIRVVGSNRQCPCISPIQMLELEQYAIADLGLNEDTLTENAARGIAEVTVQTHITSPEAISSREVKIVVVVGSHKTGARTLAAARHLRNRGFRITAAIMGREEDYPEPLKQAASAFSKASGDLMKPMELLSSFNDGLKPTLVIDALTGMHISFEDLRREDQQWCFELAIWIDRLKTKVLSIDVPSGIDPSTGAAGTADGHALAFYPDVIVALGAPKPYLLSYLDDAEHEVKVYVADLSLGRNAWKRLGGKRRTGVDFGSKWLVEVKYDAAS